MRTKRRSEIFKTIRNTSLLVLSTLLLLILTIKKTQAQNRQDVSRNCNGITVTATGDCCINYYVPPNGYNGDAGCPKMPWTGIGVVNSGTAVKGTSLVYKFSTPVNSAIISYCAINDQDSGIFTIDGGGILTISEPCNFYVGAGGQSLVGNPVNTHYGDGKAKISSTQPFTQITMTSWGPSGWGMGNLEGFILTPVPCQTAPSLSAATLANACPSLTADLNSLHAGTAPSGTTLVWYTNDTHSGSEYATPTTATSGTYYAFYYDASNSCYGPASAVTVNSTSCCPTTTPTLTNYNITPTCPATTFNLNTIHTATAPSGTTLTWFTNNAHTGNAINNATTASAGTYYAFYYSESSSCYSPASNAVTINDNTCCAFNKSAPALSSTSVSNTCPTTTVNLNSLHTGTIPNGASLVWFTNNTHTGSAYATPTSAATGTYYAYYENNGCYTNATSAVNSSSNCCAGNVAPTINSGQTPARQE